MSSNRTFFVWYPLLLKSWVSIIKIAVQTSTNVYLQHGVHLQRIHCKSYYNKPSQTMGLSNQVQSPGMNIFPLHVCTWFCSSFHTSHLFFC